MTTTLTSKAHQCQAATAGLPLSIAAVTGVLAGAGRLPWLSK